MLFIQYLSSARRGPFGKLIRLPDLALKQKKIDIRSDQVLKNIKNNYVTRVIMCNVFFVLVWMESQYV